MAEPVRPPTSADLIEAVRRTVPAAEIDRYLDASGRGADMAINAYAHQAEVLAEAIYQQSQGHFLRTHSTAGAAPASGWRFATCTIRLRRTKDLQSARLVAGETTANAPTLGDYEPVGAMILDGPGGRRYRNFGQQYWAVGDGDERDVTFICEAPGAVGNLDAWADGDGLLTVEGEGDAPNQPAYLEHANLSLDRAAPDGTVRVSLIDGIPSRIIDSGYPDQFLPQHRDLYVEILDSDAAENIGRILRIVDHNAPGVEFPAGSGLYPTEISVDDLPILKDLLSAKLDDGGAFTDYTPEAADDIADDVPLVASPATVNDAFYFGAATTFDGVASAITTAAEGDYTLTWEYWDGGAWVSMMFGFDFFDELGQWSVLGEGQVTWGTLTGWAPTAVDGVLAFWVRARVSAVVAVTTYPLAAKLQTIHEQRLSFGTCQWRVLDWRALGFEILRITVPTGGRDATLDMIAEERGARRRQSGEDDETLRDRIAELADVVSPNAIRRAINRSLEPYGMEGLAIDATTYGLFADIDAFDYYEPGDIYPENPWKLWTTESEAFGWFWIVVPCIGDGEFGTGYDEGPVIYLEPLSLFLGPAYDYAFFDGYPVTANAKYASIYETVDAIRAAGVGFTMLRSCDLNETKC